MLRLSSLLVFAAFLACGLAQTTTTAEATTTEAKATTTEAKATTTEAKATTTEAKATTTEAKPTTTEPKPTSPPPPPIGNYSYSDSNGTVCMTVIGNITLNVTFESGTEKQNNHSFHLSRDNSIDVYSGNSSCSEGESKQRFGMTFTVFGNEPDQSQFITITFEKDGNAWNASEVVYSFHTSQFPDLNVTGDAHHNFEATSNLFENNVDVGNSYSCGNAQLMFNSSDIDYKLNATLIIDGLQVQAFYTKDMPRWRLGAAQDCASGKGNKIVPIAVGAALAGLVIVVLIAYLIGRLKSRKQSSYEALS